MYDSENMLTETVMINVMAPSAGKGFDLSGITQAQKAIEGLDASIKLLQNRLMGLSTGSSFKLSAAQYAAKIPTSGAQDIRKLAKLWGFPDVKDVRNVANEIEGELQKSIARIQRKLDRTPVSPRGSTKARDALRQQIKDLQAQSLFTDPAATALKNPTRAGQFAEQYAKRALVNRTNAQQAVLGLLSGSVPAAAPVSSALSNWSKPWSKEKELALPA